MGNWWYEYEDVERIAARQGYFFLRENKRYRYWEFQRGEGYDKENVTVQYTTGTVIYKIKHTKN